jgi:hypothetical protein
MGSKKNIFLFCKIAMVAVVTYLFSFHLKDLNPSKGLISNISINKKNKHIYIARYFITDNSLYNLAKKSPSLKEPVDNKALKFSLEYLGNFNEQIKIAFQTLQNISHSI